MINKDKFLKLIFALLTLFCLAITPIIYIDEVFAASKSYEYQVLDLVNKERSKVGSAPLKMDNELFRAAKIRTKEIKTKFSHIRPDGSSCFSISSKLNGENIANGRKTPKTVMDIWMNSPPHRENILNPKYRSIGIGYLEGKVPHWVQLFSLKEAANKNNQKNVKILKTPTFSLFSGKKKITVKWRKDSKVSGYQIFRSTKEVGKYTLRKTISNKNTIKYVDKNLRKVKFFYSIRSFITTKGKRIFSNFASIQSKIPK